MRWGVAPRLRATCVLWIAPDEGGATGGFRSRPRPEREDEHDQNKHEATYAGVVREWWTWWCACRCRPGRGCASLSRSLLLESYGIERRSAHHVRASCPLWDVVGSSCSTRVFTMTQSQHLICISLVVFSAPSVVSPQSPRSPDLASRRESTQTAERAAEEGGPPARSASAQRPGPAGPTQGQRRRERVRSGQPSPSAESAEAQAETREVTGLSL